MELLHLKEAFEPYTKGGSYFVISDHNRDTIIGYVYDTEVDTVAVIWDWDGKVLHTDSKALDNSQDELTKINN